MSNKKISGFYMRASKEDKTSISKLAHRLRVPEAEAVRLAVLYLLQSDETPQLPARMRRPIVPRRKVTG